MRQTTLPELVARHPLLSGLPGDAVEHVAGCARNMSFPAGRLLQREGDPADTLYLLRRGRVRIEVHAPGRPPAVIETVGPGHIVGWSWLFPPFQWRFDARAVDGVGAIAIDGACLRAKAQEQPAFGYALLQRVAALLFDRLVASRVRLLDLYATDGRA
ncbi:MAG TPA: cyclic nucleotide-binding domain-containing protein [Acidimicrobiales bacterium]|nr:cyclic nucleotide-binding domain-containing protein [Acidimicrobiales bacterium]